MKIKIMDDHIHQSGITLLTQNGQTLVDDIKDAEAVFIRTITQIDKAFIDENPQIKYVLRSGVGLDNIDMKYCKEKGIQVFSSIGANANAAAEHTLALLFACLRKIVASDRMIRAGLWKSEKERNQFDATELPGKTIGLVGFGAIPKLIAKKLQGFDVKIISFDPFLTKEQIEIYPNTKKVEDLDELCKVSDVISVHVPLVKQTENLIGSKQLSLMKKGAILINTSRGRIIDEDALLVVLSSGKIMAGLDVFKDEPLQNNPLQEMDNVVLTCHIAGSTKEALEAVSRVAAENFLKAVK